MLRSILKTTSKLVMSGVLWASLPLSAGELVFGYSLDGSPVSYPEVIQGNKTGNVLGFCGELLDYLATEGYALSVRELAFDQRFDVFARSLQGKPGIQCGPSSKTRSREQALTATPEQFTGAFSKVFSVTSSKLLIRKSRLPVLLDHPENLLIGVLKAGEGMVPVTTALVEEVFPTSQFAGLPSRTAAVQRLLEEEGSPLAIDAYASDELVLDSLLNRDIPPEKRAEYVLEPPLYGFSREEYVLVVYNAAPLLDVVNTWLDSPQGQAAAASLKLETSAFGRDSLIALARDQHLLTLLALMAGLCLLLVAALWLGWRTRRLSRARLNAQQAALQERENLLAEQTHDLSVHETELYTYEAELSAREAALNGSGNKELTARENEVLRLLVKGHSSKESAQTLNLSPRTVEGYRQRIYAKLGVSMPLKLVEYAQKQGLI